MLLLLLLACGDDPKAGGDTAEPQQLWPVDGEFLVAVIPDTQIYAQSYPETFESQLRWIAENADTHNIVFVTHVGDIVQSGDAPEQWDACLLYTSPSPRDKRQSRMPSSA